MLSMKEARVLEELRDALKQGAKYKDPKVDTAGLNELCAGALELLAELVRTEQHCLQLKTRPLPYYADSAAGTPKLTLRDVESLLKHDNE